MHTEMILNYIKLYGYFIIFVFLFLGIVGIPAPEVSVLFLIGVMSVHNQLSFGLAVLSAILGAYTGMLTAFVCGKFVGTPFINKYGKYVGITNDRWEKARKRYTKNVKKSIVFGFFLPGLRQISPYFAGISNISFRKFSLLSLAGTVLWTVPYILVGFYAGGVVHINLKNVMYLGILCLVICLIYVLIKYRKKKKK